MSRSILVTGASGQASPYLIEILLNKGYKVYGMIRRSSTVNTERIAHLLNDIELVSGDLTDEASLIQILDKYEIEDCYNLAAMSLVPTSFLQETLTGEITGLGVVKLLSAIRIVNKKIRFVQASSSEQFGDAPAPQNENTRFSPVSPYACAKTYGFYSVQCTRKAYKMHCCNAILFNYESNFRGNAFISKKICSGVKLIKEGKLKKLKLGNLEAIRDFSHASDSMRAMNMILEHHTPDDFCVGSGESHSIRELVDLCFKYVGLNYQDYVEIDPTLFRPSEVPELRADTTKIRNVLNWQPLIDFQSLVGSMMEFELKSDKTKMMDM